MNAPTHTGVINLLRQLVGFPTVSSDSNLALIEWVEKLLTLEKVPHWRVNEGKGKASLLARIGPEVPGGIVLSGHTDVVPVKDQPWETNPFELIEKEGKLFGRGTSDMKSFLALALAYIPYFQSRALSKPIWLAFSHDEEIGCLGAAPMAKAILGHNVKPSLVIIGEPTEMKLVGAHKGIISFETIVTGREAHSSMPEQGVNAVMIMGELIHTLNEIAAAAQKKLDSRSGFPSPYTTVHVGVVEGGTARNIIPRHARICWEVRPLPNENVEALLNPFHQKMAELEREMKKIDTSAGIVTRQLTNVHGLKKEEGPHIAMACHLANSNQPLAVSYGTEGGVFQHHGLPVIVCGPGSIDQAHQPNEFVTRQQLELGESLMKRIGEWAAVSSL